MFSGLGPTELIIILVIVLVLFGAKRVPEIGASIGKGIREFKRNINDVQRTDRLGAGEPVAKSTSAEEPVREPKRLL